MRKQANMTVNHGVPGSSPGGGAKGGDGHRLFY